MINVQETHKYSKIRLSRNPDINISKIFTKYFFSFVGIHDVEIHKIQHIERSKVYDTSLSLSISMPHSSDSNNSYSTKILSNKVGEIVDNAVLPDPGITHVDRPITMHDFEIPPAIQKGGGFFSGIGDFFSRFMYKNKKHDTSSSQIDVFGSNDNDNDIELLIKKRNYEDSLVSLSDMKSRKNNSVSIYELNILGGINYLELEQIFECLDKQLEYMRNIGLQIKKWRLEYIYKIGDGYVCLDVENIEKDMQKDNREFKKELMNLLEMDTGISRISGTRLYHIYNR